MVNEKKRVLVIEDDSIMGMEMKDALEERGYEVSDVVTSGEKALAAFKAKAPDILFMDIKLKGILTGLEVARQIRGSSEAPIIFVTGYKNSSTWEQAEEIRTSFFITKPFDMIQLDKLIKQAVGEQTP